MLDIWFVIEIIVLYTIVLFVILWSFAKFENKKVAILIFFGFLFSTLFAIIIFNISNISDSNSIVFILLGVYLAIMIAYQIFFRKLIKQAKNKNNSLNKENN